MSTSRSSEDVLLIVNHVRHKKTDGVLYLMGERMGWMVESKNSFSLSHMYSDIKSQKISPDSKDKVQLQVVMHDGSAKTFHFTNPKGRDVGIKDRDGIKELLQQLLPKFRSKISSELEEKNRLLQESPELFQLYKDLVVSGVITAEEFWESRADQLSNIGKNEGSKQSVGVSAAFLADIKPQTDGCNGLKYNLTADVIESIFRTYPMVRKKHAENVPHEMTESEFWTRFFQSHYFHRDRTVLSSKDVFSDCAKNDDREIKDEVTRTVNDPLLDMLKMTDSNSGDGFGGSSDERKLSTNQTNLTMIRRFNHHSTMVLKACESNRTTKPQDATDGASGTSDNGPKRSNGAVATVTNGDTDTSSTSSDMFKEPAAKRAKIREKLAYEDLEGRTHSKNVNLRLHKTDGYLHGPRPVVLSKYMTSDDAVSASNSVSQKISDWAPELSNVLRGSAALGVLGELSPGGSLMYGTSHQQLHNMVAVDVQSELKKQYTALQELLRHFWSCFPASSKFLEEKVCRMKSTLERFQVTKLIPFKESLKQHHYTIDLVGHLEELLSTAYAKFDTWQARKMAKRS
ncbi:general transcription factor IIH subunit 1-like [Mizuhopecten yessoensis]|uniref:General transcription factor IIH subunit 1 n=1 Tax=Mizuhopecten yessoensis TaxID=6573 RepID=A0A210R191_MIZYE|nr:general transcription factor IIH subunit 1-like [Mizuhopecten yessoensis]OWF54756.1 General transcription factor IIH subunit 1 [Mizuhopecten yessoensis]